MRTDWVSMWNGSPITAYVASCARRPSTISGRPDAKLPRGRLSRMPGAGWSRRWEFFEALPENQSTLEHAFDIRLELRGPLTQLAQLRHAMERLREADVLAGRLNDDRRRGRVLGFMTNLHTLLGDVSDAFVTGARALEIARHLGELDLRITTTTLLEQAHSRFADYERVVELATDNLSVLPADRAHEGFGLAIPPCVYDRLWLVQSLAELGRFAEEAWETAEALRLAEPMHHAFTLGMAHSAAAHLHRLKGDWAKASVHSEHVITVWRKGNVALTLPMAIAASAWVLAELGEAPEALDRVREVEQLLEHHEARDERVLTRLGRANLLLGRLDEARSLAERVVHPFRHSPDA
jgi:hypothetical protein